MRSRKTRRYINATSVPVPAEFLINVIKNDTCVSLTSIGRRKRGSACCIFNLPVISSLKYTRRLSVELGYFDRYSWHFFPSPEVVLDL